ncbi:hypothetical protein Q428_04650 [Fervidicella metallireducens AeB]|uniref:Uncharacterized protein n=1 Tax=Fervidicella metallireducens AeB TaxID=1403537 RepID=A0A017RX15_9CLOT|nr:hypothetical protein [Fervidicella metallireducens]EYE89101.1 hypothetical protein Q428_04650 [Fervidicella metallireducens AeB]
MIIYEWILRIKEKRKQKQEIKIKQKFSFLIDIIVENKKSTDQKIQALYECVQNNKAGIIHELVAVNESIKKIDNNIKKLQLDINDDKTISQENIQELKKLFVENSIDIKETINSVIAKVEQINKTWLEREKQLENNLLIKSEMITSRIEDVKMLIKLLAVNELIDQIDIAAIDKQIR